MTAWTMTLWEQGNPLLQWGVVIGASLAAAIWDVTTRRIPNRLTGPMVLAGLAWSAYAGGLAGVCDAAVACLVLALPYVLLFILAGGGAGDAKLMGAIGAWLGLVNGIVVLAAVAVSGILLAIGFAMARRQFRSVLVNIVGFAYEVVFLVLGTGKSKGRQRLFLSKIEDIQKVPYGAAIFAGACIAAG
ncbi:hypothetical protein LCGC14_1844950, partial [marine sediment metagenome]